jgi:hypothetical protein
MTHASELVLSVQMVRSAVMVLLPIIDSHCCFGTLFLLGLLFPFGTLRLLGSRHTAALVLSFCLVHSDYVVLLMWSGSLSASGTLYSYGLHSGSVVLSLVVVCMINRAFLSR